MNKQLKNGSQVWWLTSVISALGRQRQEDLEFKASLSYIASSRPAWNKQENKEMNGGAEDVLRGKTQTSHVQGPGFNSQHQKKKIAKTIWKIRLIIGISKYI
jgi:hypothetical protein